MSGCRCIFAVAWLALAAGCGSEVIAEVQDWADRGCACKTTECALEVRAEFTAWVETKRSVRGSRTEKARIETSAKRMFKCLDGLKAANAEPDPIEPDPEPDPEPQPDPEPEPEQDPTSRSE